MHRDIKPENILVDRAGRVRILDFGLSKISGERAGEQLTRTDQVMGTPHYMAPEQWERPGDVDHCADIYAVGVVFYELLTGELPLGRFAPPSQVVQVDVRLDEVVLKSLEKARERRYQHASEVKSRVEELSSSAFSARASAPGPAKTARHKRASSAPEPGKSPTPSAPPNAASKSRAKPDSILDAILGQPLANYSRPPDEFRGRWGLASGIKLVTVLLAVLTLLTAILLLMDKSVPIRPWNVYFKLP